jgi:cytosine/adenosine deaminase-related metal-dependent hydrolase
MELNMSYLIRGASAIFSHPSHITDIRIQQGVITEIGSNLQKLDENEVELNAHNCVIYPGFVNTHHHLAQSVLKAIPQGLNQALGDWLASVPYRYWPRISPKLMYLAAKLGMYELMRSGTTTCADHHYLYHAHSSDEIEQALWQAADEMGMRFVLCRGGATVMGSHKGMRDAGIEPESLDQMLGRLESSFSLYHDESDQAMKKLVVAPTSLIHSVRPDDLKVLAEFARHHKLKLHSHLLEVDFDEQQAQQKFSMGAVEYADSVNWLGEDVFFAHLVKASSIDIQHLAQTKTGISHCPTSNCRLGSGIADVLTMEDQGMPISVGVDGSASSENASMLQELNLAWLLHRSQHGADATQVEQVIRWGSEGGAGILGLKNLGKLEVGQAADISVFDLSALRYVGMHSTVEAPLMAGEPAHVKYGLINGVLRVKDGQVLGMDELQLIQQIHEELILLKNDVGG